MPFSRIHFSTGSIFSASSAISSARQAFASAITTLAPHSFSSSLESTDAQSVNIHIGRDKSERFIHRKRHFISSCQILQPDTLNSYFFAKIRKLLAIFRACGCLTSSLSINFKGIIENNSIYKNQYRNLDPKENVMANHS